MKFIKKYIEPIVAIAISLFYVGLVMWIAYFRHL